MYTSNPNLFDSCWLELFVVNVRLDLLYDRVRNVVLVVVKEALEELARVLQHGLARLPVVVHLGRRRGEGGEGRGKGGKLVTCTHIQIKGCVSSTASMAYRS